MAPPGESAGDAASDSAGGVRETAAQVVGAVLLLLTWLYVGSLALVAGAVTNAGLADAVADTQT